MARVEQPSETPPRLLDAILNLAQFHRDHEKFYASAPREQAVILQRHGRTLCALADRWSTVDPSTREVFSPFEGAVDLNDGAALQLDGVLFMEGEGEPAEITRLKCGLGISRPATTPTTKPPTTSPPTTPSTTSSPPARSSS